MNTNTHTITNAFRYFRGTQYDRFELEREPQTHTHKQM